MSSRTHSACRHSSRYALLAISLLASDAALAADFWAYVGTATNNSESKGIYVYRFQPGRGRLTALGLAAVASNPSFLTADKANRHVYAVNENAQGTVSAFAIDPATGKLRLLNVVSSHGSGPCHLTLDRTGRWLAVANYGSGSFAVLPVKEDGSLGESVAFQQHRGSGPNRDRQQGPHAHCVLFSADNRYLLVADLGLDRVMVYRFDPTTGAVAPNDPPFGSVPAGAGARHLLFHPNGRYLYTIDEMQSAVTTFSWDAARGALEPLQTVSSLPAGFPRRQHRRRTGHQQRRDPPLRLQPRQRYHRSFCHRPTAFYPHPDGVCAAPWAKCPATSLIDPTGKYLLAETRDSDTIAVFKLNPQGGQMAPAPRPTVHAPKPVCLVFVPRR